MPANQKFRISGSDFLLTFTFWQACSAKLWRKNADARRITSNQGVIAFFFLTRESSVR
jgi:hypothetical protein